MKIFKVVFVLFVVISLAACANHRQFQVSEGCTVHQIGTSDPAIIGLHGATQQIHVNCNENVTTVAADTAFATSGVLGRVVDAYAANQKADAIKNQKPSSVSYDNSVIDVAGGSSSATGGEGGDAEANPNVDVEGPEVDVDTDVDAVSESNPEVTSTVKPNMSVRPNIDVDSRSRSDSDSDARGYGGEGGHGGRGGQGGNGYGGEGGRGGNADVDQSRHDNRHDYSEDRSRRQVITQNNNGCKKKHCRRN
jgi:hypothetical protein